MYFPCHLGKDNGQARKLAAVNRNKPKARQQTFWSQGKCRIPLLQDAEFTHLEDRADLSCVNKAGRGIQQAGWTFGFHSLLEGVVRRSFEAWMIRLALIEPDAMAPSTKPLHPSAQSPDANMTLP